MVSNGSSSEFTAFGDPINVAAHLAAQAAPGGILVTDTSAAQASLATDGLERRRLSLKGYATDAVCHPGVRAGALTAGVAATGAASPSSAESRCLPREGQRDSSP